MPAWSYDSYCNDNVKEYIEENRDKLSEKLEEDIKDFLADYPSEMDLEFIVGIAVYGMRTGIKLSDFMLRTIRSIIDYLLENGKFGEWEDKEKRCIKLGYERKIINNLLKGNKLKFGRLIEKPERFENLNDNI